MTPDDTALPSDRPTARTAGGTGGTDGDAATGRLVGGRYRLARSLGRGGMGVVWAARDVTLDRDVAIKEVTLPPGLDEGQRAQLRERTLREARAAARIRSAAAVTVYDVVEEDGRPWIVMELLPPRSLAEVIREEGPLPADRAARTGLRLLEALSAAHAVGVLHRDVKPANVLFDATGRAVLTDFGIASLEGEVSMTTTGTVVGSPGYVAPERALGRPPSPASDLWSLGVTLAAAVHGRSPFEKDTPLATVVAAMQDPLPQAVVTGPLGDVIDRLLAKDPSERPDVDEARRLLEAAASGTAPAGTTMMPAVMPAVMPSVMPAVAPGVHPGAVRAPHGADAELTQALPRVPASPAARPTSARRPVPSRPADAATATAAVTATATDDRRSRLLPVLLAVVLVVAAIMVAVVVMDRRDDATFAGDPTTAPAAGPTPGSAPTTAAVQEPAAPGPEAEDTTAAAPAEPERSQGGGAGVGEAPEGFQLHEDPGYRVAVPQGWTVEQDSDTRTTFQDPSSGRYLLIEEGGEPAGDPVEDWEQQEKSVSKRLGGYELLGIERADYRDFDSADWQFRWDADEGRLRVLNRAVVDTEINRAYALYWSVPDEDWDAAQPVFDGIAGSFEPLG